MLHCAVITLEISRWNNCHSATRIKKTLTTTDLETHLICAQGSQFENLSQNTLDMPYDTTQGLCRTCPGGRIGRTREASYEWLEHQRKCSQYYAHKHTHTHIQYLHTYTDQPIFLRPTWQWVGFYFVNTRYAGRNTR